MINLFYSALLFYISFYDYKYLRIKNVHVVLIIILAIVNSRESMLIGLLYGAIIALIIIISQAASMGDAKFIIANGMFIGSDILLFVIVSHIMLIIATKLGYKNRGYAVFFFCSYMFLEVFTLLNRNGVI